ncbi:MAG: ribonuclease HII, partial [Prolixibacteraceae bacterium]|nr:ribonuclease HII [Prolixibacteraceae bacterium]
MVKSKLLSYFKKNLIEAGCDEAGRGCLAGPVFAAAVILPPDFENEILNDSKKLTEKQRYKLRPLIEKEALAWAVESVSNEKIDEVNILNASFLAMNMAVEKLKIQPRHLLIDGNRFRTQSKIPFTCMIKG